MIKQNITLAGTCAAALFPMAASSSFGGTPCRGDFACHFQVWGILLGVVGGIQVSGVIFVLLHLRFRHHARSTVGQWLLAAFFGIVAFEIAAACAALMGAWGNTTVGYHDSYPMIGFLPAYLALAIVYVLHLRSGHRHPRTDAD